MNLNPNRQQDPHVLTWSLRNIQNFVYNSCLFEFEDIISEVDAAKTVAPPQYDWLGKLINKTVVSKTRRLKSVPLTGVNPYIKADTLEDEYDVYFVTLDFPWYVSSVNQLKGWRKKCKLAVCYIVEIWTEDLPKMAKFMDFFDQFDLICIGTHHVLEDVQKMISTPCMFLPSGVDTMKFYPNFESGKRRSIDVCSLGKRSAATHDALLNKAEKESFFYYHELTDGSVLRVDDHQAHRTLVANLLKSSRYRITNYTKAELPERIAGEYEIGYRFFEGAAAGNVLIGAPPKGDLYGKYFDWEDSIIPVNFDEPNIAEVIDELDARPGYIESIQARNVMNSLLKHDWVYRWEQVLDKLGLPTDSKLEARKRRLKEMAIALEPKARSVVTTVPSIAAEQTKTVEQSIATEQTEKAAVLAR